MRPERHGRRQHSVTDARVPTGERFPRYLPVPDGCEVYTVIAFGVSLERTRPVLTTEELAAEFGPLAPHARRAIRAFYLAVREARNLEVVPLSEERGLRLDSKAESQEFLRGLGLSVSASAAEVVVAVDTYYALLLKCIAALAVGKLATGPAVRTVLSELESGRPFREAGFRNFLDGMDFAWYLSAWDRQMSAAVVPVVERLSEYRLSRDPQDLVKNLYLALVPKSIRHDLGEYYTPDWLAEQLLVDTLGRSELGNPGTRVLDPACGSGTFLVGLIRHAKQRVASGGMSRSRALRLILENVVGVDRNPLAVLAARINYVVALGDWLEAREEEIEIPVHLADSLLDPLRMERFDFVIGNPPWVNWQHLPKAYRQATMPLWEHYGLFPKRPAGMDTILGAAKCDLSMLMTYVAADRYLRQGGRLGFVVPQALFKSAGAGQGFRRCQLPDQTPLGLSLVHDFVQRRPFEAANRTATMVMEKGRPIRYPVEYRYYSRRRGGSYLWRARPISAADPTSPWIAARPATLAAMARILGGSPYRAREGANSGGANGVFWMDVNEARGGSLLVRNVVSGARKKVPATVAPVEADLVYPLLRGQNVGRWRALPASSILLTHRPGMKLRAIPEREMAQLFPQSSSYLKGFRELLRDRPAFKRYFRAGAPFYSLFNIGTYTFSPWKVVWREQAWPFTAAVTGPLDGKAVIPDHKLMLVPLASEEEAHYLCGVLNSLPVSAVVAAYTIAVQVDTHVLEHIRVPLFSPENRIHRQLALGSRKAHAAVANRDPERLRAAECAVNTLAARMWGLTEADLEEMQEFLHESAT